MIDAYTELGKQHGTAMFWDCSEPDADAFLAYMERRLPAHGVEAYMDGFMAGKLGECKCEFPQLRGLRKAGSEEDES